MSEAFVVKDSGERRQFETGSVRDVRAGKGRFDLIPAYPLKRLAKLYEAGAVKYGDHNWQKGQNLASYLDSCLRHINEFRLGETSEDHLAAAAWNLFSYIHTEQMIKEGRLPADLNDVDEWRFYGLKEKENPAQPTS